MSKKKKPTFTEQVRHEIANLKTNVQAYDKQINERIQTKKTELKHEQNLIEQRLAELHPIWCEVWRLKKRNERIERKLKQY